MRRIADYEHRHTASNGFEAKSRVRVFEPEECSSGPVVVVSEPDQAGYDGPSVTNNIEQIAGEVVYHFALPSSQTVFIEHYPPEAEPAVPTRTRDERETFDLVTFASDEPTEARGGRGWFVRLGEPDWEAVDRQAVEGLIGRGLQP
jgi:hypothetical protein